MKVSTEEIALRVLRLRERYRTWAKVLEMEAPRWFASVDVDALDFGADDDVRGTMYGVELPGVEPLQQPDSVDVPDSAAGVDAAPRYVIGQPREDHSVPSFLPGFVEIGLETLLGEGPNEGTITSVKPTEADRVYVGEYVENEDYHDELVAWLASWNHDIEGLWALLSAEARAAIKWRRAQTRRLTLQLVGQGELLLDG